MPASRLATALGLLMGLTGPGLACVSGPDAQRMTPQAAGSPDIYAILDPPVISQPTGLELVVCGAGDITGLVVDAWMPSHRHGMNYEPEIAILDEGRYAVTNMVYHMPGLWQLKVMLRSGTRKAAYVLDIPIR